MAFMSSKVPSLPGRIHEEGDTVEIPIDFRLMIRLMRKSLFHSKGTPAPLTPRRLAILMGISLLYGVHQIANWTGFFLDEIFFRGYRWVEVRKPVFVVGPLRSGTTFFHRLLALDKQFTGIRVWEIGFAPSVVQKRFFKILERFDKLLGEPFSRRIREWERRRVHNVVHTTGLFELEEDEAMLLHIFSSGFFLSFLFPYWEELEPLFLFDRMLPDRERRRIMNFYEGIVKRHLHVYGPQKRFLAKNPAFSTKLESLRKNFPDACVILLLRSPLETIPSSLSLLSFYGAPFYRAKDPSNVRDLGLRMMEAFYHEPLRSLERWPVEQRAVILYDDLVADPEKVVKDLYLRMGWTLTKEFETRLLKEKERAKTYRSGHAYSLAKFGLSREEIVSTFGEIFERFRFDPSEHAEDRALFNDEGKQMGHAP